MTYLFVFTLGILILNMVEVFLDLTNRSQIDYKGISLTDWRLFYPSFFYQVYWWSVYLGLVDSLFQ